MTSQVVGDEPQQPVESSAIPEEAVHLPDAVVKNISNFLISNEAPGNALLNLLSFCSVCKQWRSVARELNNGVCLGFDSFDNTFSSQASVQKFRKLTTQQKQETFLAAARLFQGKVGLQPCPRRLPEKNVCTSRPCGRHVVYCCTFYQE